MLRPCAFVLDDAHAGIEEIRDSFTLHISGTELHEELLQILDKPCKQFRPGKWTDILNRDPGQFMEMPFWIWKTLLADIDKLLAQYLADEELQFVIPYVRDVLRWCRCVVSGIGIEIIPEVLPVFKSAAYFSAKHRLFMSATLADDAILLRELACDITAAQNPLIPSNDKGLGERMVVTPSLVDSRLDREWVMSLCAKIAKRLSVVVLSPSEQRARDWESVGAKVFLGDDVRIAIEGLKSGTGGLSLAVLVQRYDGVDLPDNACRVLVLDGMPLGEGIVDRYDSSISALAGGTRNRIVYRIEQGMGRAVRSHADYAVILLVGNELAHFIAKHEVLSSMNPDTQAQLRLAIDLAKLAMEDFQSSPEEAVIDMMKQCLSRDNGWKQFYNETIRSVDRSASKRTDLNRLLMAHAERNAFDAALANDPAQSVQILREAINKYIEGDESTKGWYLQRVANYLHEADPGEALEVQRSAYENNRCMICPPSIVKRPKKIDTVDPQAVITEWYRQFANPNGAIASIEELKSRLSFDLSSAVIEQAVCELAQLLGAQGSRPEHEYGEGPDDLWLWPELAFVIEAKTQNEVSLHKSDAEQLIWSVEWFKRNYPTRDEPAPVVIAKVTLCDRGAGFPPRTKVITEEKIQALLDTLEQFYRKIISEPLFASTPQALLRIQQRFKLTPEQFIGSFTQELQGARRR